jgi:hypothetical protein
MTRLRGVGVGLVFLVGCAVGGAASRFTVPPASAQQAASLTKWEYFEIDFDGDRASTLRKVNEAGAQGWEAFFHGDSGRYYMRRPRL